MKQSASPELQLDIERFVYEEAAVLDRHEYREWLGLFAADLVYQMPVTTNYHEQAVGAPPPPAPQAYYFHDDLRTLTQRVKRLETGKGWAEMPPSRTRRMLSNVILTPADVAGEWNVACNFLLYRSRLERQVDLFIGARVDHLRPHAGGSRWKIARRDLTLDQGTLIANNLSIFF
ncbi:aromatic-ring-hydroxylating dioxygenase subunit beta [Nevskia ramosa]|uniref:aromatic-ring-hydroxylating dioxygenase subunit beta n=1 Tax=Nevskia ramosa TaxID=64002 RepID=UPI0025CCE40B|nr:3-phenylpropionate/cinnamic acid dioxygenase subunit beta [uncultured Nevskia sp.]